MAMISIISFLLRKRQTHRSQAKSLIDTNANKKFNLRQGGIQIHSNYNYVFWLIILFISSLTI